MASKAMTQLMAVIRKEVGQTLRDKKMMAILLVAPMIQLFILGEAMDYTIDRVPTVVVDQDRSASGREIVSELLADGTLRSTGEAPLEEAEHRLEDGSAAAALVIPPGFGAALDAGRPARVQVLLDGTDPNRSGVAGAAVTRFFAEESAARIPLGRRGPALQLEPKVYYNPTLDTGVFVVPGMAAMLLLIATTLITGMGLAREKELGTYEQILVTPIPPWVLLLGKVLPFIVVGIINVLEALTVGAWVFGVPLRGDFLFLGAATLAYMLSTLGAGLLISTVSNSQQQAFLGTFLFLVPALLLSGTMTPISTMPRIMQLVTYLNPLRYYIEVLRASLLRGAGFADLWSQLVALTILGTALLTVATLKFRKTLG